MASSFTVSLAVLDPTSPGVNVTEIVQLAPDARVFGEIGQLLPGAKSAALVPEIVTLEIVCETASLLVRTAVIAALVVPCFCVLKVRLLGEMLMGAMVGTTPDPGLKLPV